MEYYSLVPISFDIILAWRESNRDSGVWFMHNVRCDLQSDSRSRFARDALQTRLFPGARLVARYLRVIFIFSHLQRIFLYCSSSINQVKIELRTCRQKCRCFVSSLCRHGYCICANSIITTNGTINSKIQYLLFIVYILYCSLFNNALYVHENRFIQINSSSSASNVDLYQSGVKILKLVESFKPRKKSL